MPTLVVETLINSSPEICFDLVRKIGFRLQADKQNYAGKNSGEIALGETAVFEKKYFGFTQRLIVKVIELEKPFHFTDEMVEGGFKSFKHTHEFIPENNQTRLRDTLVWTSPLGILGKIFDSLLLKNYLRKFVMRRNAEIKKAAEISFQ